MIQRGFREVVWLLQGASAAFWVVPESVSSISSLAFSSASIRHQHSSTDGGLPRSSRPAEGRGLTLSNSPRDIGQTQHQQMPATAWDSAKERAQLACVDYSRISKGLAMSSAAFHSQAALDSGSDDDSKHGQPCTSGNGSASSHIHAGPKQHQQQAHVYHSHQRSHINHKHSQSQSHKHSQHQHYPHRQSLATGQLHAAHGRRRHATSSSNPPDPLSQQLLGAKGMGVLRRIMLKYKANMGPEQVANTLLALQHLVLQTRQQRGAQRPIALHLAQEEFSKQQMLQPRDAWGRPRVHAVQNLAPKIITRPADRDGPMEQLTSQVLGELGNMIWHFLGDMSGPELAKLLYSWARLEWHPESQLLADVTASFHAAAAAGLHLQQKQHAGACVPAPVECGPCEPWMAAGLWGLCKIEQPLTVASLQLLLQEWPRLLPLWGAQQLVDIAWALTATADEQTVAELQHPAAEAREVASVAQLQPVVLGLAEQLVHVLQALHNTAVSALPLAWPEVLVHAASGCQASGNGQQQRWQQQQHVATGPRVVPPQLAWRMLQAVAGVGVDVRVVSSGKVEQLVDALSREMQLQGRV